MIRMNTDCNTDRRRLVGRRERGPGCQIDRIWRLPYIRPGIRHVRVVTGVFLRCISSDSISDQPGECTACRPYRTALLTLQYDYDARIVHVSSRCLHSAWCWNPPTASAVAGPSTSSGDGSASATPPHGGVIGPSNGRAFPEIYLVSAEQHEAAL